MLLLQIFTAIAVLSGYATAKAYTHNSLLRRNEPGDILGDEAINLVAALIRRDEATLTQSAPQFSSTPATGDASKIDPTQWKAQTQAACQNALGALNGQASNPSGLAVCYNLPFLDSKTGVFEAELRMYNVSVPIDPWKGVTAVDVSMSLSYLGATIQNMNGTFTKRDISWPPIKLRDASDITLVERQSTNVFDELKVLMYVGKINSNLMGSAMTQSTLQPLLIPTIQLSAKSSTGSQVETTLSSTEASFVNGVFSKQTTTTATGIAAAASASDAASSIAPFPIPGTTLAFFPTGLLIACLWTLAFVSVVGAGTIGRIQFRDEYRRRTRTESIKHQRTI